MNSKRTKRIAAMILCISVMLMTLSVGLFSVFAEDNIANITAEADEHACTCGETAPDNLALHTDSCPRKEYIKSLYQGKSVNQLYEDWKGYDYQTQIDLLNILEAYNYTTWDQLTSMIGDIGDVVANELTQLEKEYTNVTEDTCEDFYDKMMSSYSKAFDSDETLVTGEQLKKIDDEFSAMQSSLYNDFGFTDLEQLPSASAISEDDDDFDWDTFGDSGEIYSYKNVKVGEKNVSDYILSLESYITGQTIDYVQPLDLILVLDQSASMYAPMGLERGLSNSSLYTGTTVNLTRYALDAGESGVPTGCLDLREAINSTEKDSAGLTFMDKVKQLGYLVAQSRSGGTIYCTKNHNNTTDNGKHNEKCKTWDWFVVQYVENDPDGKPWHFHRIKHTACPSQDGNKDEEYTDLLVKYAENEIGEHHFYYYKSQTGALYDAITAFAAAMKASGADHRLAVTGFSAANSSLAGDNPNDPFGSGIYVNGELIPYNSNRTYQYWRNDLPFGYDESTITEEQYASALMSVQSNWDGVTKSLNAVKTDYYQTYQNIGLDMALNIIKNATKVETDLTDQVRQKAVVLFTDGEPSGPKKADIVLKAAEVKATGADLYTVCTSTLPASDRAFLTYSSSDYPNATATAGGADSTIESGAQIANPKYAKTASNAEALVSEFIDIFNNVVADLGGANVQLTERTILQDAISSDFSLPKELTDKLKKGESVDDIINKYIKVYTAPYNGTSFGEKVPYNDAKVIVEKNAAGEYNIVKVTNFNYTDNYITKEARGENNDFYGCKLVLEIAINPSETNFGGNFQATNDETNTGVYFEGVKFRTFDTPHVDVPTTVTVTKYVVGKNADTSQQFDFTTTMNTFDDHEHSDANGNYLKIISSDINDSFRLSNSHSKTYEEVKVGTEFIIYEAPNEDYNAKIRVYDRNDKLIANAATLQKDGSYKITVVPGMKIVYTNTVTNAGLVITKNYKGVSEKDVADQGTLFKIVGANGVEIEVAIEGSNSITVNNLPVGEYTVTEIKDWTWRYTLENVKTVISDDSTSVTDGVKIYLTEEGEQIVFTNTLKEKKWLSGDCYCENIFKKKNEDDEQSSID